MHKPLNIIVCIDSARGFAKNGKIPWHFKKDLAHFKRTTKGHYCIMGRRTFEDMVKSLEKRKGRSLRYAEPVLPGRESIVLSRNGAYDAVGHKVHSELQLALDKTCTDSSKEIFILGGDKLFTEALPITKRIYMTIIDREYGCDQTFPGLGVPLDYIEKNFRLAEFRSEKTSNRKNARTLCFTTWERK